MCDQIESELVPVDDETIAAFAKKRRTKKKARPIEADIIEDATVEHEIITGVVLTRCPVLAWNRYSGVIVYERDGKRYQTNAIDYHGEGYIEIE